MKKNYLPLLFNLLLLSPALIWGQQAASLNFDGQNDQVNCGNGNSARITGSNITLEAIVKFDSFKTNVWEGNIINKEQGGAGTDFGYMLRAGQNGMVNFNLGDGNWHEISSPINTVSTGVWHHIAGTYDGTTMRLFVDGSQVAQQTIVMSIGNSNENLVIGNWSQGPGREIDASIDEIRIWNIARTPTEIDTFKDSSIPVNSNGLVALFDFNQGIAGGSNPSETTLLDSTNNNNGTLNNFSLSGNVSNWIGDSLLSEPDQSDLSVMTISPNPMKDRFVINHLPSISSYRIYNSLGSLVAKGNAKPEEFIMVDQLPSGIYFLRLKDQHTFKLVLR
ncbi:LamG-like jellyroll fold domain-containing protein [Nonlabens xiamenensis]|uniref:LamG-like jellyroll fold domain-containing protein n=1 Tax=Nonlabens xiamenensis TaxID=2341043 RepID=UPI000F610366|nr:LamG-like jellyroll fold domain-containing protein [Nonlabens xiamenensis]